MNYPWSLLLHEKEIMENLGVVPHTGQVQDLPLYQETTV